MLHCATHMAKEPNVPLYSPRKCFQLDFKCHRNSCLPRHYVNRSLPRLQVLYLITDSTGHLGLQSEYLNT